MGRGLTDARNNVNHGTRQQTVLRPDVNQPITASWMFSDPLSPPCKREQSMLEDFTTYSVALVSPPLQKKPSVHSKVALEVPQFGQ